MACSFSSNARNIDMYTIQLNLMLMWADGLACKFHPSPYNPVYFRKLFTLLATCLILVYYWLFPEDRDDMFLRNYLEYHRFTWRYILEDRTIHSHSYENIKSKFNAFILVFWNIYIFLF
jgi:hypothetical protein